MKRLCVVGDPVEHSVSPILHNAAIEALGLQDEYVYEKEKVAEGELKDFITSVRTSNITGMGVTMPHKETIVPLLDELSEDAKLTNSVNTVVKKEGLLHGYTTDGEGVVRALEASGRYPQGKEVVVVGAGGAAKPIVIALARAGVAKLAVHNRTAAKAKEVAGLVGGWVRYGGLDTLKRSLSDAKIIVNATSVGMNSTVDGKSAIPAELLKNEMVVVDLVYTPLETRLLRDARNAGAKIINGTEVLLHQADSQFELFTGKRPPIEPMRKALEKYLEANG